MCGGRDGIGFKKVGYARVKKERRINVMSKNDSGLQALLEQAAALQAAMTLFEWDNETLAPQGTAEYTAKIIGSLSGQYREIMTSRELKSLAEECRGEKCPEKGKKDRDERKEAVLREVLEEAERLECIPAGEYRTYTELTAKATGIWARARSRNDFSLFAPVLKEIIKYQKRFASYRAKPGQKQYDVMLDSYEKGFDMKTLDVFFHRLKEEIVPLLHQAAERCRHVPVDFLECGYPEADQERAARFLAEYLGFDFSRGVLAVSAHPFTTSLHNHDVRITTSYRPRIDSSLFSVIHETGHALYEQGIRDDLTLTLAGQGASMGMHECQSRFFENIIGRSHAFWEPIYGKIGEIFGEPLKSTSLDTFLSAVNRVEPGPIRTEADELSYSLHILVRYELEKLLVEEDMPVEQLPEKWNEKYREYLGICPESDREGVLQDIHWSQGSFGYFPSYALGSAFGAQIYAHMKRELPVEEWLVRGEIRKIREYLREKIHQYGKLKDSRTLLRDVTGEDFTPDYYIAYLKEKYGA